MNSQADGRGPGAGEAAGAGRAEELLSFVLRAGEVKLDALRYADGELEIHLRAKVDQASLQAFAAGLAAGRAEGGDAPGAGAAPARRPRVPGRDEVKPPAAIRYVCPRCKTPGSQPGDKVGAIVTCRKCGKAMKLTVKR